MDGNYKHSGLGRYSTTFILILIFVFLLWLLQAIPLIT
jgi:hypothetical protein